MNLMQSTILGFVQGITEFLPVSSSGHLILVPKILGWQDQGLAFDVFVHLGTLLAVIIYFRKDIKEILFNPIYRNFLFILIVATIPAGLAGFLFDDFIENKFRSEYVVAFSLIFWGIVLFFAERFFQKRSQKETRISTIGFKKGIFIGLAQAVALIPGTSRSGVTITAGLFSGLDRVAAARFSFLLSIPIILGAGSFKAIKLTHGDLDLIVLGVGFLASMLSGLLAINFLLKIVSKYSYNIFVAYRIILAIVILLFLNFKI